MSPKLAHASEQTLGDLERLDLVPPRNDTGDELRGREGGSEREEEEKRGMSEREEGRRGQSSGEEGRRAVFVCDATEDVRL
mmetsp:Transcript_17080/g.34918  ORF Transcript_17080/g.34918 Transcript_17080/m.34918 type:complete len:81 (-) Transcript_17080:991-1233(-)